MNAGSEHSWLRRHPLTIFGIVVVLGVLIAIIAGVTMRSVWVGIAAGGAVGILALFVGPMVAFLANRSEDEA